MESASEEKSEGSVEDESSLSGAESVSDVEMDKPEEEDEEGAGEDQADASEYEDEQDDGEEEQESDQEDRQSTSEEDEEDKDDDDEDFLADCNPRRRRQRVSTRRSKAVVVSESEQDDSQDSEEEQLESSSSGESDDSQDDETYSGAGGRRTRQCRARRGNSAHKAQQLRRSSRVMADEARQHVVRGRDSSDSESEGEREERQRRQEEEKRREEEEHAAIACQVCKSLEDDDNMLLCDGCDVGVHIYCLTPALDKIPDGHWYCTECLESLACEWCGHVATLESHQKEALPDNEVNAKDEQQHILNVEDLHPDEVIINDSQVNLESTAKMDYSEVMGSSDRKS